MPRPLCSDTTVQCYVAHTLLNALLFCSGQCTTQDTLLANTGRQYYKNCKVAGTVDFVYGDAIGVFENCQFVFRHGKGKKVYLTASKRELPDSPTGFVVQSSTIELENKADVGFTRGYFGRPWRDYAKTVILNTYLGEVSETLR